MDDGEPNPNDVRGLAKAGTLDGDLVDREVIAPLRVAHQSKLDSARQIAEAMGLFDLLDD